MNFFRVIKSILLVIGSTLLIQAGCRFSFRDVSIPPEVKTVKINYVKNEARYINPQLSPRLTDQIRQKIISQTRLTQTQEDADYEISCIVTDYSVTTSGISNQEAASNNLNITVRIVFKNRLDEKGSFDSNITRNFPYSANLTLQQAEQRLQDEILKNLTDEIFNRIFSNW
jgi:Lipopolysaccharide-assembly